MLSKLKAELFKDKVQMTLLNAKIDKTHDFVHPLKLKQVSNLIMNPKLKNQIIKSLQRRFRSNDYTLKIKALIAIHHCLRQKFDEEICQMILSLEIETTNNPSSLVDQYVKEHVLSYYLVYLKKLCMLKRTFFYSLQSKQALINCSSVDMAENGFKILNLANYLLRSQQMFNKMGRYHPTYYDILSMFIQFLKDLDIFNEYFKKSVGLIIQKSSSTKVHQSFETSLLASGRIFNSLKQEHETMTTSSTTRDCIPSTKIEKTIFIDQNQVRHSFVYINQAQKISDRFYEFYNNKYYFKILSKAMKFPTFLNIEIDEYDQLKKRTKSVDKSLVNLIKKSKFDSETKLNISDFKTESKSEKTHRFFNIKSKNNQSKLQSVFNDCHI